MNSWIAIINSRKPYLVKVTWGVLSAFALFLPLILSNPYLIHVCTIYFLYIILALGLNVVVNHAGLLDLGYVAFFAVGAYFYGIFSTAFGLSFWISLPLGASLAAILGIILGFPTLRVREDYLALVTLGFGEMVRLLLVNWTSVTRGPKGIPAIPPPSILHFQLKNPSSYYYLTFVVLILAILFSKRLSEIHIAKIWGAIRDEETAAKSCGINSIVWLLGAFAVGAFFAGTVGVFFASIQRFVSPESFVLWESILVLSIVVLAEQKSMARLFIATGLLFLVPEFLRGLQQYRPLSFGILLIGFVILEEKWRERRTKPAVKTKLKGTFDVYRIPIEVTLNKSLSNTTLLLESVSKSFGGLKAVDDISTKISFTGNITALIGSNGAGKTTLFNCLTGVERLTSGRIRLDLAGNISNRKSFQIARMGFARTFQSVKLFRSFTAYENILIGSYCGERLPILSAFWNGKRYRRFVERCRQKVEFVISFLGIEEIRDTQVADLPLGYQRKVEIGRALAMNPKVLLLDEPASGMNNAEKKNLMDILQSIAIDLGISIFLIEHDMEFVMALAQDIIVMDAGKIISRGTPEFVRNDEKVIESYLGRSEVAHA